MTKPFFYSYKNLLNGEALMNSNFSNALYDIGNGIYFYDLPNGEFSCFTMPDLLVDVSEENQSGNIVTLTEKTVKVIIFYCNAGTEYAEGGDGSKDHPWASVNYALGQLERYMSCLFRFCNEHILLECSGVCDYPVRPIKKSGSGEWVDFRLACYNNLIIRNLSINISKKVQARPSGTETLTGISLIEGSYFVDCNVEISQEMPWDESVEEGYVSTLGIDCPDSPGLINCSVVIKVISEHILATAARVRAFYNSFDAAKIINCSCEVAVNITGFLPIVESYGFCRFYSGIFYNCHSTISVSADTFLDPSLVADHSVAISEASGFYANVNSIFSSCKGVGIATSKRVESFSDGYARSSGYGFLNCSNIFEKCEGFGEANSNGGPLAENRQRRAAGFYGAGSDSQFFECTTSEPVCENLNCDRFSPDI